MCLPSNPTSRKAIKACLDEISASMTRIAGERDFIKEAIVNICEEHELNKKTFKKLARTYHKQNFASEVAEHEEFEEMYELLTGQTTLGSSNETDIQS